MVENDLQNIVLCFYYCSTLHPNFLRVGFEVFLSAPGIKPSPFDCQCIKCWWSQSKFNIFSHNWSAGKLCQFMNLDFNFLITKVPACIHMVSDKIPSFALGYLSNGMRVLPVSICVLQLYSDLWCRAIETLWFNRPGAAVDRQTHPVLPFYVALGYFHRRWAPASTS